MSTQTKIVKFGGTSLSCAENIRRCAEIVKSDPSRRYVVVSAPGKRTPEDTKITDMLYNCYEAYSENHTLGDEIFAEISARFQEIAQQLAIDLDMSSILSEVKISFRLRLGRDFAASRGEYLNARIIASYLGYDFIDAADIIFFGEDGIFDGERTNNTLRAKLKLHKNAVIPGFYGSMPNDTIRTFSRGGSDVTGSIVARAAEAELYENWTDVDGFLMADPRIVDNPKIIDCLTYRELRELAYMGATVLHEDSIIPAKFGGVPINIRNTMNPSAPGTIIGPHCHTTSPITGITGKRGFAAITIESDGMNAEIGFVRKFLSVLENHRVSLEHMPTGIDSMTAVVAKSSISNIREKLMADICRAVNPESVHIADDLALISVVGNGMRFAPGTAGKIFSALAKAGVNTRLINQEANEISIITGVAESDFENAIRAIYAEFQGE